MRREIPLPEPAIRETEARLYQGIQTAAPRIQRSHPLEMQILRWCMKDSSLRTQVLRFIDCLPSLQSHQETLRHLKEYFPTQKMRLPPALRLGLAAARPGLFTGRLVAGATQATASTMARLFIAGSTLEEAFHAIRRLEEQGFQVSVDLLGEATVSQAEADQYGQRYLELLEKWASDLSSPPHLSLKLSALAFPFDPMDPEGAWRRIRPRLRAILQAAFNQSGFVNIDMEQFHLRDLTLRLTQQIMDEEFPKESRIGLVIQAYLKDSEEVTRQMIRWARSRGAPITLRLVRGAYWDTEVIRSVQQNWPCPVYTRKSDTDLSFERLTDLLLENHRQVRPAIGTHNVRSIARALVKAQELGVSKEDWECQVLYGIGESIQEAVLTLGVPVRIYCPVGDLLPGMAYLVRRILENTSQSSFVAMSLDVAL